MKTVVLGGSLGKRFGESFRLNVKTPAEAVRALCSQIEGLKQALAEAEDYGVEFAVFLGARGIDPKTELHDPAGADVIRIQPIPAGAKKGGLFQTILGAALIASVFIMPQSMAAYELFAVGASSFTVGGVLFGLGATLALGGLSQMLAPQQKLNMGSTTEQQANRSFNGVVNTMTQGDSVPLALGRCLIGSYTVSGSVYAYDGSQLVQGVTSDGRPGFAIMKPPPG